MLAKLSDQLSGIIFFNSMGRYFLVVLLVACLSFPNKLKSQNIEAKVISYNALVGGFSGGIGALINKKKEQKWHKVFLKGFVTGLCGGAISYSGKKLNYLVGNNHELGYAWLSRAVFSAGNSIVENAAANRPFWSQWHYDVGFIRLQINTNGPVSFTPRFMPSSFGGFVFMAVHSTGFDYKTSLQSGTLTFTTKQIGYSDHLVASTASNGFLIVDSLKTGNRFHEVFAHEMVHAFQFQEFSGVNYFFNPLTDRWKSKSQKYAKLSKWIYGDLNYECMLINYFIINQAYKGTPNYYCKNYLENEAEFLSVGRSACFER